MAEARFMLELGERHAYMDTDSIFVPPKCAQELINYFQPLNPYSVDLQLLKSIIMMSGIMESHLNDMFFTIMKMEKLLLSKIRRMRSHTNCMD